MQDLSLDYLMLSVFLDDTRGVDLFVPTRTSEGKKPGLKRSAMRSNSLKVCGGKTLYSPIDLHSARCSHIPVVRRMGKSDSCYTTPRRRRCWAAYTGHDEWLAQTQRTKTKQIKRERGIATASLEDSEHNEIREIHSPLSQHFWPTGQSVSNLQSLATSQFSRQVPLQQFDFLPAW